MKPNNTDYHGDFKGVIVTLLQVTKQNEVVGTTDGRLMGGHKVT